jgi:hypothetical protein
MAEVNRPYWHNVWPDDDWLGAGGGDFSYWSDAGEFVDFDRTEREEEVSDSGEA